MTEHEAQRLEHLEKIRVQAKHMRKAQKDYFRDRTVGLLDHSKRAERDLDLLIQQYDAITNPQARLV